MEFLTKENALIAQVIREPKEERRNYEEFRLFYYNELRGISMFLLPYDNYFWEQLVMADILYL